MRIFTSLNMKTPMAAVAADSAICHAVRFKSIESIVQALWNNVPSLEHNSESGSRELVATFLAVTTARRAFQDQVKMYKIGVYKCRVVARPLRSLL